MKELGVEEGGKIIVNIYNCCVWFFFINLIFLFLLRSDELKEHPFFAGLDWQQVYMQKYTPPLIPPRGEVNAADAFDIGSFDEEDTKGIKVKLKKFSFS